MRFEAPLWFLAFAGIALGCGTWLLFRKWGRLRRPAVLFANLPPLLRQPPTWRIRALWGLRALFVAALCLLVIALARPQKGRSDSVVLSRGIDIMMVVDTSGSMAALDFGGDKTRLEHAVDVMKEFVDRRRNDRIGLISFAAHAWTRCPMTLDYGLLESFLDFVLNEWKRAYDSLQKKTAGLFGRNPEFTPQELDLQATAIGDAIVAAAARLESSDSKSKIIILLTDGSSNAGDTEPLESAELAAQLGIRIYTVGAGSNRAAPVWTYDFSGRRVKRLQTFPLDEETLKEIAAKTNGRYFRARDRESLESVYETIDGLEKSELKVKDYREWDERFQPFAYAALAALFLHALLSMTVLRRVP